MTSVVDKIQKRRFFPVELDWITLHIRPMGAWERHDLRGLEYRDQLVFAIGCCLVNEDRSRAFERQQNESVAEFVLRVRNATLDLSPDEVTLLTEAITKVTRPPPAETIAGNSEPTDAPAS